MFHEFCGGVFGFDGKDPLIQDASRGAAWPRKKAEKTN